MFKTSYSRVKELLNDDPTLSNDYLQILIGSTIKTLVLYRKAIALDIEDLEVTADLPIPTLLSYLPGSTNGVLTVVDFNLTKDLVTAVCVCGNSGIYSLSAFLTGDYTACGTRKGKVGLQFGKHPELQFTITGCAENLGNGYRHTYKCPNGHSRVSQIGALRRTGSCPACVREAEIGNVYISPSSGPMVVTGVSDEAVGKEHLYTVRFKLTGGVTTARLSLIRKGCVPDPLAVTNNGLGYRGSDYVIVGKAPRKIPSIVTKRWTHLLSDLEDSKGRLPGEDKYTGIGYDIEIFDRSNFARWLMNHVSYPELASSEITLTPEQQALPRHKRKISFDNLIIIPSEKTNH